MCVCAYIYIYIHIYIYICISLIYNLMHTCSEPGAQPLSGRRGAGSQIRTF